MYESRAADRSVRAPGSAADGGRFLVLRAGNRICALPIVHAVETMRPLPVEPVPGTPPYVLGLSMVRGAPAPVVALGPLCGAASGGAITRFVLARVGPRRLVLAVDFVVGVSDLQGADLADMPPLVSVVSSEAVEKIGTLDDRLLFLLRATRILDESAWSACEAGESAR